MLISIIICQQSDAGNLTADFLAGKELNIIDNTAWQQAQFKKNNANVIHVLIYQDTVVFIEPKTLVHASHHIKNALPKTNNQITQSIVDEATLQAINEFIAADERKKVLVEWIKNKKIPMLCTVLIPGTIDYQKIPLISNTAQLSKLKLKILIPRPRESFPTALQASPTPS